MTITLAHYPITNTGANDANKANANLLAIRDGANTRCICIGIYESDEDVAVGDGTLAIPIPADLNGYDLTDALATVHTKGATGTTDIMVRRRRSGTDADMLTTAITIGDEFYANDEGVNASNDDVATGDQLYIDIDAVHTTAPKGLSVVLTFTKP